MRAQWAVGKSVGGGPTERRMISNYSSTHLGLNTSDNISQLPESLKFTDNHLAVIIAYSVLFVIAAIGNLTVFITLVRGRHRMNRISLMITHLSVADLCVTFFMIPLEIGWRITTQWLAGNAACKIFLFLRAFGLYLSSNVLVCVSVDRYFAILHPLRVHNARRRGKIMLVVAWMFSFICALPQLILQVAIVQQYNFHDTKSVVFHVSQHPNYPGFWQCVSFGFFATQAAETAYNLFCVFAMYFVPLIVIIFAYTCILWKISKKSRETRVDSESEVVRGRMRLRRSDMSNIERARSKTLKMTVTIVVAFIWCWTPYAVITLWYMFDRESAKKIDYRIQDALFIMAVSNSCMNPLVYGSYAMNFRRECQTCFGSLFNSHHHLHRRSTDGGGRTGDVLFVPKCVLNLVKGSGGTRSSAVAALGNLNHNHNRNQLTINRRNLRPVSAEQLMTVDRNESDEFHSDPGGANGIYLVAS